MTEQTKAKILALLAMGFSLPDIAREVGVTSITLTRGMDGHTATSGRTEQKIGECFKKFVGIRATQVNDAMGFM